MQLPSCLSELRFCSLLQYSPESASSRAATIEIKRGSRSYIERIGARVEEILAASQWSEFFGHEVQLVPVPRSKPLVDPDALWPARRLCQEFVRRGLASDVSIRLARASAVAKSALLRSAEARPGPDDHIRTLQVTERLGLFVPKRILLVDDVVTRGATLLGAASVLQHACPATDIRAFAAVRTMSRAEIDRMLAPVAGVIAIHGGRLHREP